MKKICTLFFLFLTYTAFAQQASVVLVSPGETPVAFSSITSAYSAIPYSPSANYIIEILSTYIGHDASEIFPIKLSDKGLAPGGPTITIRPAAENKGQVIQRRVPAAGSVIQINGGDNIIIDGRPGGITSAPIHYLSIKDAYAGSSTNRNIEIINGANDNTIQNVNMQAATTTGATEGSINILIDNGTGIGNLDNKILHNIITGGMRGIQVIGTNTNPGMGITIKENIVRNFGNMGIGIENALSNCILENNIIEFTNGYTSTQTGVVAMAHYGIGGTTFITGNTMQNITSETGSITGLHLSTKEAPGITHISGNKIINLRTNTNSQVRGMSVFPFTGSTVNITNNFLSITGENAHANSIYGILLGQLSSASSHYNASLYFNTIKIGGEQNAGNNGAVYGIYKSDSSASSHYNQVNNICIMNRTGGGATNFVAFYNASGKGVLTINHNTYYATDLQNGWAAGVNGLLYKNNELVFYKARTNYDENSNFTDVSFISASDLHLAGFSMINPALKGIPVTGIHFDIDGNSRSALNPTKGADEPGGPVPVQMFAFAGTANGSYNLLTWSTASESNNSGFEVQRSIDGFNFQPIGFVPTKSDNGSSSTNLQYAFEDVKPFSTNNYYRLKQVDKDGRGVYSNIVTIRGIGVKQMTISNLYPNPVRDNLTLVLATDRGGILTVWVTDITGKTMMHNNISVKAGDNLIPVKTAHLLRGVYVLRVIHQHTFEMMTVQFMK
jgi:hypothetical protein